VTSVVLPEPLQPASPITRMHALYGLLGGSFHGAHGARND
jgi:hypothetical protein